MANDKTYDLNIESASPLISPVSLKEATPLDARHLDLVTESRSVIRSIVRRKDRRLLAIVGPCSIHDRDAAIEYAERLSSLRKKMADRIYIIMRVYFEKPRTVLGWRGLITDPHLDGSYDIPGGLRQAREILLKITALGVPAGSEMLDPIVPQYIDDLISWAAIGARTTESQIHREMASGLSMPVGFKNGTDGGYETAVNALKSTMTGHSFIGIDQTGKTSVLTTRGNPGCHVISRGGERGPNCTPALLRGAQELIRETGIEPAILVDCSHGNSGKRHAKQEAVLRRIMPQVNEPGTPIIGFMIESNLFEGNQSISAKRADLAYGVSVTDECVGWDTTETMLEFAYNIL